MKKLRIVTADPHDVFRRGLKSVLSPHPGWCVCGEARLSADALRLASQIKPDIVTIEFDLPDLNGIETAWRIRQSQPNTEILFYTTHDEEHIIAGALKAGVRGHVLKSDREEILIEAIAALANHRPYLSTKAAQMLLDRFLKAGAKMNETILTRREREIVRFIAEGESNRIMASHFHISVKTVEAHRATIMRKLEFRSITDLVRYAIRNRLVSD